MVEELYRNEIIDNQIKNELLELNKIRNMLFHGHIDSVDKKFINTIDELSTRLSFSFLKMDPNWLDTVDQSVDGTLNRIVEKEFNKAIDKALKSEEIEE